MAAQKHIDHHALIATPALVVDECRAAAEAASPRGASRAGEEQPALIDRSLLTSILTVREVVDEAMQGRGQLGVVHAACAAAASGSSAARRRPKNASRVPVITPITAAAATPQRKAPR